MALRKILSQAAQYEDELDFIELRLDMLQTLGALLISDDYKTVGMTMETLPINGAQPTTYPIFPNASPIAMIFGQSQVNTSDPSQPIGFTRVYKPEELGDSNIMTISIDFETHIALAIIDQAIKKLREKKRIIIEQSKKIIRVE